MSDGYQHRPKKASPVVKRRGIVAIDSHPATLTRASERTRNFRSTISVHERDEPQFTLGHLNFGSAAFFESYPPNSFDKIILSFLETHNNIPLLCYSWNAVDKMSAWVNATSHGEEKEEDEEKCPVTGLASPGRRRRRNYFAIIVSEWERPLSLHPADDRLGNNCSFLSPLVSDV